MAQLQLLPGKMNAFLNMSPEKSIWDSRVVQTSPWTYEHKVVDLFGAIDWGRTITGTIPRNCDRLAKLYVVMDLYQLNSGSGGGRFVDYIGFRAFTSISLSLANFLKLPITLGVGRRIFARSRITSTLYFLSHSRS